MLKLSDRLYEITDPLLSICLNRQSIVPYPTHPASSSAMVFPVSPEPSCGLGRNSKQASAIRATTMPPSLLPDAASPNRRKAAIRSEEHTSELQSLMSSSYAVF